MNLLISAFNALPKSPEVVIFDYDGTIARVPVDWPAERSRFRRHLLALDPGVEIPEGLRVDDMEALLLRENSIPRDEIFANRRRLETGLTGAHEPIQATLELIDFLKLSSPQTPLLILSNNLAETARSGLRQLGLSERFSAIYGVDSVGLPKPATKAAEILRDEQKIILENCLFVGDSSSTDAAFAEKLNIPFINITKL